MADETPQTTVGLKLLVDTKANKVLFAEANKEFVDFLFHIFSLPVGMVVKLLMARGMVGSLGDLYKSIRELNADYLQPNLQKDLVLKPQCAVTIPLLSLNDAPTGKQFYRCSDHSSYVSDAPEADCPDCNKKMSSEMSYVPPKGFGDIATSGSGATGGYVKGVVTYMITDNLQVKPMSTISCLTIINRFHVQDVSSLEEREVQVGLNEGLAMLKASLETRAALTTVFLGVKEVKS